MIVTPVLLKYEPLDHQPADIVLPLTVPVLWQRLTVTSVVPPYQPTSKIRLSRLTPTSTTPMLLDLGPARPQQAKQPHRKSSPRMVRCEMA